MASDVTEEDNRKVQTAVLGGSQGHQPVFLPFETYARRSGEPFVRALVRDEVP
ncbi:hypothetical protein [Streptomyces sp. NPDC056628]|uniref:hypothetical protein n=1 Tax=Streptomyces sp. NPDC056628 TaxID=3345882 RepID=UPI00369BCFF6